MALPFPISPFTKRLLGRLLSTTGLCYFPVRIRGGYAANARWTLYPWTAYWRGTHEPEVQQVLAGLGDVRGWSCWDLGAHYGLYSVGLALRTGATGEVSAFEPNPVSHRRLERHRQMNRLGWMRTFAAAVSDAEGTAELYTYGDIESTSTHLPYEDENRSPQAAPVPVPILTLDGLVAAGKIRPPDFVKVDVEGHGHKALRGARRALAAKRPILLVAFHSLPEVEGTFEVLEPLGYTWRRVGDESKANDRPGPEMITHDYQFTPRK